MNCNPLCLILLLSVFCGGCGCGGYAANNDCGCGGYAAANDCGCNNGGFFGGFGGGNSCSILIWILLLSCICGGSFFGGYDRCGCGCGC